MEFDQPQFTRSDVVAITGVDTEALKSWLKHGFIDVTPHQGNGPRGRRLFSIMDMIKIAVASELSQLSIPSTIANEIIASEKFADWVALSTYHDESKPAEPTIIVLYRKDGTMIVDYLKGKALQSYWDIANQHVPSSVKAYVVLRLPEIVASIEQNAHELVLAETPPDELSAADRSILAMRRALQERK